MRFCTGLVLLVFAPAVALSFIAPVPLQTRHGGACFSQSKAPWLRAPATPRPMRTLPVLSQQRGLVLEAELSEEKVTELFAWVSRAFAGEDMYNDLNLALIAIFGNLPDDSEPREMVRSALEQLPDEEEPVGASILTRDRERASLGAMGAAQWTGQWMTRPHALLVIKNLTSSEEWIKSLSRGARRTLARASTQNFTVTARDIKGGYPAPHSSLAHFRCVVEHEVRVLAKDPDYFFDALAQAVSRYMGTTRMTGQIREYRNADGKVMAFAHEVRKGRTIRGQWFYGDDEAARSYVWFHSVQDLVERAIAADGVDVVDLGPSGSDAFSELKERYGFVSVNDWPAVADYTSSGFWHPEGEGGVSELQGLIETLMKRG